MIATRVRSATVVSPAATLQAASRLLPIPWGLLRFAIADHSVTLAVDASVMEKAPSFLSENWPDTLRAAWDTALKAFWATAGERAVLPEEIGPPWRVPVRLTDFRIEMESRVMPGAVQFEITNAGDLPHSFHIAGGGVDEGLERDLEPGESAVFSIELPAGSYMVYCPVGRHAQRGMTASLTVGMMPLEGTATPRAGTATVAPLATAPTGTRAAPSPTPVPTGTRAAPALTPLPRGTLAVPSPTGTRAVPTRDNSF